MNEESQNIEWKQCWQDEYLKWICGFANAQGGCIFIGKDDAGQVVGLKNAKKLAGKQKLQKRGLMQKLLTGEWRVKVESAA